MATTTTTHQDDDAAALSPLRTVRRKNFMDKFMENRPAVEYGNITLIHKKLDSWIDAKPTQPHYTWTEQHDGHLAKLNDNDRLSRRKERLSKKRGKLQRSWSGNIDLIQRDSLIDVLPHKASPKSTTKRTKPRRISGGSKKNTRRGSSVHPKDVLLDGDLQTVRKVHLEKKLCQRPVLPYTPEGYGPALVKEVQKRQQKQVVPVKVADRRKILHRFHSFGGHNNSKNRVMMTMTPMRQHQPQQHSRPVLLMPTSA